MPLSLAMYNVHSTTMIGHRDDLGIASEKPGGVMGYPLKIRFSNRVASTFWFLLQRRNSSFLQSARQGGPLSTHVITGFFSACTGNTMFCSAEKRRN